MDMSIQNNLAKISLNKSIYAKKHYSTKLPPKVNDLMYRFSGNFVFEVKKLVDDLGLIKKYGNCHFNVIEHVNKYGGKVVSGWLFGSSGQTAKMGMWFWSFHSIWETADGLWIDVTEGKNNESKGRTVFCADNYRKIDIDEGISYNNICIISSASLAEKYTEYCEAKINNREIYWCNDDLSILRKLKEHNGKYRWLGGEYEKNFEILKEKYNIICNEDDSLDLSNIKGSIEDAYFDFSLKMRAE